MKKMILLILVLLFSTAAMSQTRAYKEADSTINYKYSVTFGLWPEGKSAVYNLSYSFSLGNIFYKIGYLTRSTNIFMGKSGSNVFNYSSLDLSLGWSFQNDWIRITPFLGPSLVYGPIRKNGYGRFDSFNTGGVQLETQFFFRTSEVAGIGVSVYGNWNTEYNFSGFNIMFNFGN